jgi:hypothetical protein
MQGLWGSGMEFDKEIKRLERRCVRQLSQGQLIKNYQAEITRQTTKF